MIVSGPLHLALPHAVVFVTPETPPSAPTDVSTVTVQVNSTDTVTVP